MYKEPITAEEVIDSVNSTAFPLDRPNMVISCRIL